MKFFNTAGKAKDRPVAVRYSSEAARAIAGSWSLVIQTPLGQNISATLTLQNAEKGLTGNINSEMGDGELLSATFDGKSFVGTVAFDVAGQNVNAQVEGELNNDELNGTLTVENTPPLPFSGERKPLT
jgi:hypothetical protein